VSRTVLVLGATSAIAAAYCRRIAPSGAQFVLVGRNPGRLKAVALDLKARGAADAVAMPSDLADMADCAPRFAAFIEGGTPDEVIIAYGVLGRQEVAETDPGEARRIIDVNFTSAALWLQVAAAALTGDKPRSIVVIGSVAGDRGRRSNYVYGSAKAGLDVFAEGLAHRLHGGNVHVLTVKPGFVDTPMTAHIDRGGPLWAKPERVAADIERAVRRRRRVLYTPWFWRPIMFVVRIVPRPLFYRTRL
jgi:NAD(P)-dependent dehydrogenase (short-subunit alcohol dehydrogenase family)